MQLKQFIEDDEAVSPVIGVILMVAITVILAAVIATFVLGLGEQISDTGPTASFEFDYDGASNELTVTHVSGSEIEPTELYIRWDGNSKQWGGTGSSVVTAGSSKTVTGVSSDDTVRVVWDGSDSSQSKTVQQWQG